MRIAGSRILLDGRLTAATLLVAHDGTIAAIGPRDTADIDLGEALVVPGFVDRHCHGGGGANFATLDAAQARSAAAAHAHHGTTTIMASLVTATTEDLLAQITTLAPLVDDHTVAGIHLEGPWISRHQCGAHDMSLLRAPDLAEVAQLVDAAGGRIRMVTLAPELPGSAEAIRFLSDHGIVVAIGHTEATYDQTRAAIDAGATAATHLLNRMRPIGKREPGAALALAADPRITIELVADGVHLHPDVLAYFARNAGFGRTAVITDAMAAAGATEGDYLIGALPVVVADGVARLADTGALAGSTLTMDAALRHLVHGCGFDVTQASRMLSATPAAAMGWRDRGTLKPGNRADLVVLDDDLEVRAVMQNGRWLSTPTAGDDQG